MIHIPARELWRRKQRMKIRVGYELIYECPQPTPMILNVNAHYSRASDIVIPDHVTCDPAVSVNGYRDAYGNWCSRIVPPTVASESPRLAP
jgi:hypothetical protein